MKIIKTYRNFYFSSVIIEPLPGSRRGALRCLVNQGQTKQTLSPALPELIFYTIYMGLNPFFSNYILNRNKITGRHSSNIFFT